MIDPADLHDPNPEPQDDEQPDEDGDVMPPPESIGDDSDAGADDGDLADLDPIDAPTPPVADADDPDDA